MIRWMEENPAAVVLIAFSGILVLVALMLSVVWSLPPSATQQEQAEVAGELSLDVPELLNSEPIDRYAVITERPAFNASRQPQALLDTDESELEDDPEEDVDAPEVELAGVIITPSIRMVTLKPKEGSESLVAFEGQPLEGDYGSWHVSNIEPRKVTLSSGQGEEMELSLAVHDQTMQAPARQEEEKSEPDSPDDSQTAQRDSDQPLTRAEEIRQRIAERREELKRAAEEQSAEPADTVAEDKPVPYRSVMEQMIAAGKDKQAKDEN